jgi:hypothetical protein
LSDLPIEQRATPVDAEACEHTDRVEAVQDGLNHRRPHRALSHKPPIARLDEASRRATIRASHHARGPRLARDEL